MSPLRKENRKATLFVAGTLIIAAIGGGVASHELVGSNASQTAFNLQSAGPAGVPFLGPFAANPKHGTVCGKAVRLMEGALRRTTPPIRTTPARNCVGIATTNQLIRFQKRHHIPASGIYGARTHAALAHAYSKQQRLDLIYLQRRHADALRRATVLIVTSHAYALKGLMHYCGSGDYNGHLSNCFQRGNWPAWPDVPRHTDCSGYVSWVLFQAGLGYISGSAWPATTRTLANLGSPVPINGPLKVGDVVLYELNDSHTAIYIGHGLVSSHGKPGLDIHPYGYRLIYGIRRLF